MRLTDLMDMLSFLNRIDYFGRYPSVKESSGQASEGWTRVFEIQQSS